ncbi:MAG: hypothetical protein ABIZ04_00740 [Opitutus sp.]
MSSPLPLFLAEYHRPLFGNQWLALLAILAGIGVFMFIVRQVGFWLAATHPVSAPAQSAAAHASSATAFPDAQTLAIIAAAVATTLGARAKITAIRPAQPPSVETLMQQWSLEGRRQIYSSHQIR